MKILIENYTFTASAKTIVFNDYTEINQAGLLLITNTTDGIIMYNFASPTLGGSIVGNTLTLAYDTVSMSDDDAIQIFYEDGIYGSSVDDDSALSLVIQLLLQRAADDPIWYDVATNALRITGAISGAVTISSGTVTTVTTVASMTNQVNMGGQSADLMTENLTEIDWALTTRNLLTFT